MVAIGWLVHHSDILTAFLNGDINGELYVSWDGISYSFNKSLYGLKQSPCLWYKKLRKNLKSFGFKQSDFCECIFKYKHTKIEVVVLVFVDDLLVLCAYIYGISWGKSELKSLFI